MDASPASDAHVRFICPFSLGSGVAARLRGWRGAPSVVVDSVTATVRFGTLESGALMTMETARLLACPVSKVTAPLDVACADPESAATVGETVTYRIPPSRMSAV